VCTSATLSVAGDFSFWAAWTGAASQDNKPLLAGAYPSPFPYRSRVLVAAPKDAPDPSDAARFKAFVNNAAPQLALASGGGALVLFTSFDALNSCYAAARPILEAQGIRCLCQGEDDRSRLLRAFVDDPNSVLFGADSFWEGVDAPGETLRSLIMCRLPFRLPNDPVFQARCEAAEREGLNPFMALSVPEAVMKFRQGFGRLVRRSTDGGAVTILDRRVISKPYGRLFLQSLPETRTCFDDFSGVLGAAKRFWDALADQRLTPPS
jgi:ATP-dependent DNA helicase DinG